MSAAAVMGVGDVYGHWTVLELLPPSRPGSRNWRALVQCSCGTVTSSQRGNLTSGRSKRCRRCQTKRRVARSLGLTTDQVWVRARHRVAYRRRTRAATA
jgi:hypothetical protein